MSYEVKITDTATGETVSRTYPGEWDEGVEFWWTEGNMACDSNRGPEFLRAKGLSPSEFPCSCAADAGRFAVELPDGRED